MTSKETQIKLEKYLDYLEHLQRCSSFEGPPGASYYIRSAVSNFKSKFAKELTSTAETEETSNK